jgi:hypothetical protein
MTTDSVLMTNEFNSLADQDVYTLNDDSESAPYRSTAQRLGDTSTDSALRAKQQPGVNSLNSESKPVLKSRVSFIGSFLVSGESVTKSRIWMRGRGRVKISTGTYVCIHVCINGIYGKGMIDFDSFKDWWSNLLFNDVLGLKQVGVTQIFSDRVAVHFSTKKMVLGGGYFWLVKRRGRRFRMSWL